MAQRNKKISEFTQLSYYTGSEILPLAYNNKNYAISIDDMLKPVNERIDEIEAGSGSGEAFRRLSYQVEQLACTVDITYATAYTAYEMVETAYTLAYNSYSYVNTAYEIAETAYSYAETANQAIDVLNGNDSTEGSIGYRIKAILAEANKKAEALKNLRTVTTEKVGDNVVSYSYISSEITYNTDSEGQATYSIDISVKYGNADHDGIALYSTVEEMVAEAKAIAYTYTYSALDWQIF